MKKVATQAEREAEDACAAKEKHAQAIAHGVVPMMMEREQRRPIEQRRLLFRGPFKDHCHDSCLGRNCVSSDGRKLYGRWPVDRDYILPLCLHTCLCPQQGGHPCPARQLDFDESSAISAWSFPFLICCYQSKREPNAPFPFVSPREVRKPQRDSNLQP